MPWLSLESRRRVISLYKAGYTITKIRARLQEENVLVTNRSLQRLIVKYKEFNTYEDLLHRTREKKLTSEMIAFMDAAYEEDDEISARKMKKMSTEKWPTLEVSIDTIKRTRRALGWVCTHPHYCQLVRDMNKRVV